MRMTTRKIKRPLAGFEEAAIMLRHFRAMLMRRRPRRGGWDVAFVGVIYLMR